MAMPGKTDGPGGDPDARAGPDAHAWPPGSRADAGRAPGSQDELRRRLANLPVSHPSSPRYRGGQPDGRPPGRSGREGGSPESAAARPDDPRARRSEESGADGPGASRGARSEQSRVNRAGLPAARRDEPATETPRRRQGERRGAGDRDDGEQDKRAPGPSGGAAAVEAAARLIRGGRPRAPEQEAKDRKADDALWARAAAMHAAAQARR